MHIQKVLNSSVVLVQDDSGEESILCLFIHISEPTRPY